VRDQFRQSLDQKAIKTEFDSQEKYGVMVPRGGTNESNKINGLQKSGEVNRCISLHSFPIRTSPRFRSEVALGRGTPIGAYVCFLEYIDGTQSLLGPVRFDP